MQIEGYPSSIIIQGRVKSGLGNFGFWLEKLADSYALKTGMRFYPGTLNIEVNEPYTIPLNATRLETSEYGGTVAVSMVPCAINGRDAFVLRTDANEQGIGPHPQTIVEIASDVHLRALFDLHDGDSVELCLPIGGPN